MRSITQAAQFRDHIWLSTSNGTSTWLVEVGRFVIDLSFLLSRNRVLKGLNCFVTLRP